MTTLNSKQHNLLLTISNMSDSHRISYRTDWGNKMDFAPQKLVDELCGKGMLIHQREKNIHARGVRYYAVTDTGLAYLEGNSDYQPVKLTAAQIRTIVQVIKHTFRITKDDLIEGQGKPDDFTTKQLRYDSPMPTYITLNVLRNNGLLTGDKWQSHFTDLAWDVFVNSVTDEDRNAHQQVDAATQRSDAFRMLMPTHATRKALGIEDDELFAVNVRFIPGESAEHDSYAITLEASLPTKWNPFTLHLSKFEGRPVERKMGNFSQYSGGSFRINSVEMEQVAEMMVKGLELAEKLAAFDLKAALAE